MKQAREPSKLPLKIGDKGGDVKRLRKHLEKYGYLQSPCHCHDVLFCDHVSESVEKYQRFFHLPVTGQLDQATFEQMKKPRCGIPDLPKNGSQLAATPYFGLNGGKWDHTNITFFFKNGTGDISGTHEWDLIRQAFDKWAAVTPLTFTEVADETIADIRIAWEVGDHGDGHPFDGQGDVLAHTFTPPPVNSGPIAGDMHFDNSDTWDTEDGGIFSDDVDLLSVAIHEIGHALGLDHTNVEGACMWPSYEGERRTLSPDDIEGIQELYGPPTVPAGGFFTEASVWALRSTGGYGSVTINLGEERRKFVAWGTVTMIDSLSELDDDNAVAMEVFKVDGNETFKAVFGGEHWGDPGESSNVHQGAFVGFGSSVTFRLRAMHHDDLDAFGTATVIALN